MNQNNAAAEPGKQRYRLAVSDGEHWMSALIATQMAHLVTENRLVVNTVLRLKEYIVQDLGGRKCAPALASQHGPACATLAAPGLLRHSRSPS